MKQQRNGLTGEQKRFVCRLFAEFEPPEKIRQALRQQYGIHLALPSIIHYRDSDKWGPIIEQMRKSLIEHIGDIPLCSKYYRLKRLDELFHSENHYRVVRYSGRSEHPIEEKPVGELRQLCALAAQELGELKSVLEHDASASLEEIILGAITRRNGAAGR